ncbi:hypothetical protein IJJ08_03730 [bacterium]|nr:hypothetical protein [bacterium]
MSRSRFYPTKVTKKVFEAIKLDLTCYHPYSYIKNRYNIARETLRIIKSCNSYEMYKKHYADKRHRRLALKVCLTNENIAALASEQQVIRDRIDIQALIARQMSGTINKLRLAVLLTEISVAMILVGLLMRMY